MHSSITADLSARRIYRDRALYWLFFLCCSAIAALMLHAFGTGRDIRLMLQPSR